MQAQTAVDLNWLRMEVSYHHLRTPAPPRFITAVVNLGEGKNRRSHALWLVAAGGEVKKQKKIKLNNACNFIGERQRWSAKTKTVGGERNRRRKATMSGQSPTELCFDSLKNEHSSGRELKQKLARALVKSHSRPWFWKSARNCHGRLLLSAREPVVA